MTTTARCHGCICDPVLCETDDTGQHCADAMCGSCLHGCPDEDVHGCPGCRAQSAPSTEE